MTVSITCPQCRATMRSPSPVPVGKRVKCPKCLSVFGVPPQNGVKANQSSVPGVRPAPPSAQGLASRPSYSPRRKSGRRKFLLVLASLFMLMALASGGYLYLTSGGGTTTPNTSAPAVASAPASQATPAPQLAPPRITDDPLAYVPADSSLVMGFDAAALWQLALVKDSADPVLQSPQIGPWVAELKRTTGLGIEDLERCVIAGTGALTAERPASLVIVARTKAPVDAAKLASLPDVIETKKAGNRSYHTLKSSALSLPYEMRACCTPIDRLVVLALGRARQVEAVMAAAGTAPTVPAELMPLVRKAEKSTAWVVAALDDGSRQQLEGRLPALLAQAPPELHEPLKSLPQARAAGLWIAADPKELNIAAGLLFPSDSLAQNLAGPVSGTWNKLKQPLQEQFQPLLKELPADLRALIDDVFQNSIIAADGPLAQASLRLRMPALEGLAKAARTVGPQTLFASIGQAQARAKAPGAVPEAGENEKGLAAQMNKTRDADMLHPFKGDKKLYAAAHGLAKLAAKEGSFVNLENDVLTNAVKESGYEAINFNANFAIAPGKEIDPLMIVEKWLADEVAKGRLLSKDFHECGIGVAASDTELFIVVLMATPRKQ